MRTLVLTYLPLPFLQVNIPFQWRSVFSETSYCLDIGVCGQCLFDIFTRDQFLTKSFTCKCPKVTLSMEKTMVAMVNTALKSVFGL